MAGISEQRQWMMVDPLGTRYEPKETERAGTLESNESVAGYMTTRDPELASEIQQRYPHMLCYEHNPLIGQQRTHTIMWTLPEMPWKRNVPNGTRAEDSGGQSQALESVKEDVGGGPEVNEDG